MIYFIQTADNQYVKVGKADNPAKRLLELQTAAPQKLKLLATLAGGHEQERAIHQRFEHLRARGEWFYATPDLVSYAVSSNALKAAPIDTPKMQRFFKFTLLEPGLLGLYAEAAAIIDNGESPSFCANAEFYGYWGKRGFESRICQLVGWEAYTNHPLLLTSDAYDVAYETIYEALPDCRDCICA